VATSDLYGLIGQVLDGQFRVDRAIGEGGFSVVYRGHHVGLDEPVAIKCLKLQTQLGSALVEAFIRRFRDESKIHYRLSRGSLHIARTIAAGTTMAPAMGALVPYMVLEWLEGYTLSEELRARRERGESGRTLQEVIRLLDPVAEAMAYAHAQGVVHRDLNPSNIFVAHAHGSSKLKVLDFGVAKVISDHALSLGPRAATIGQIRMFTPAYAAPEQFHETLGPISPRTDVYSFAVMVVELLADRTPIEGEHIGEYADRALDPERRPTPKSLGISVGDAVEAVIARAVTVDPSQRPSDIGEFWGMLKNAANRDAHANRAGGAPGFPKPPLDAAPSARHGYVPRITAGGLPGLSADAASSPLTPAQATVQRDEERGDRRYGRSDPALAGHDMTGKGAAAARLADTALSGGTRREDSTAPQPTQEGRSHPSGSAPKATLFQGGLGPGRASAAGESGWPRAVPSGSYATPEIRVVPTPVPTPATDPASRRVSSATAFAATMTTPGGSSPPSNNRTGGSSPQLGDTAQSPSPIAAPIDSSLGNAEVPSSQPAKRSGLQLFVVIALALTVALVVVAVVANQLAH